MIQASFAKPVGLFDNWFNKFVTWITRGSIAILSLSFPGTKKLRSDSFRR